MDLSKLLTLEEEVTLKRGESEVKLTLRRPNLFVLSRAQKVAEVEKLKYKLDDENRKRIEMRVNDLPLEAVLDELSAQEASLDLLKASERLRSEKFPEYEKMVEITTQKKVKKEVREKAQEYVDKYFDALEKEGSRIIESRKSALKNVKEETLRKRLVDALLEAEAQLHALNEVKAFYLKELCYYNGKPAFNSIDEVKSLDDEYLSLLLRKLDEMTLREIEKKKFPLEATF